MCFSHYSISMPYGLDLPLMHRLTSPSEMFHYMGRLWSIPVQPESRNLDDRYTFIWGAEKQFRLYRILWEFRCSCKSILLLCSPLRKTQHHFRSVSRHAGYGRLLCFSPLFKPFVLNCQQVENEKKKFISCIYCVKVCWLQRNWNRDDSCF